MAQPVTCLLHRHKDLNLDPSHPHENPGEVEASCNFHLRDAVIETERTQ